MQPTTYNIKTEIFEGPLDLLLSLIEKRKLFINDISLAKVTDDYIAYVNNQQELPLSQTAHFILIASILLLIKSKSLLPVLELSEEEESDIEELERRLRLYKRMKALSGHVEKCFGKHMLFAKSPNRETEPIFSPEKGLTVEMLLHNMRDVLVNLPKKEILPKTVVEKVISLEEMIRTLTERINKGLKMSFREFSKEGREKTHIVVSFLAMLELVKQGLISVTQSDCFSDITMESSSKQP